MGMQHDWATVSQLYTYFNLKPNVFELYLSIGILELHTFLSRTT